MKPSCGVFLCDIPPRKNNKPSLRGFSWKSVLTKELSCIKFLDIQEEWWELWLHLCNSLFEWSYIVQMRATCNREECWYRKFLLTLHKKFISHFWSAKKSFFVKQLPHFTLMTGPTQTPKKVDHYICSIHLLIKKNSISRYFLQIRRFFANLAGSGPELNYRCFIVCLCFFGKNTFRFPRSYFIVDPQKLFQDSTPSQER
jgi:hypothetical protein